ncbi:FG-GAP-like repeat-containing protein [Actinacidiphila glaucinigra]|uniref:FG-GAP repeat-containing protein n=1 Tax=Actinacidiphila glaucinigra TaxID=235986 RepID=A0A239NW45_9ACTN|nr:FG-GAP-like repeat-containing protein [Actinacidiphila glaucinigra]SNT59076.1 FG-GAP repeat-containing protein [Actinacidiphila glaucinigra]
MRVRVLALALTATAACLALPSQAAVAASPAKPYDFNGDGYPDLAIGVPGGTAAGKKAAGYVAVIPGSASGPRTSARTTVSQSTAGIPGSSETGDRFGARLTSGDLDRNGYADLIVVASGEDRTALEDTGRITILWGSASGFTRGTILPGSGAYKGTGFAGLAAADVNGDGNLDIVTGNRGDESGGLSTALGPFAPGRAPAALTTVTDDGIPHFVERIRLAVGDLDGDGRTDAAVAYNGIEGGGTAYLRGTAAGLVRAPSWYGETTGESLAAGDFDGDGHADLAVGLAGFGPHDTEEPWVPEHPLPTRTGGIVRVLYGSAQGPAATRPPVDLDQNTAGVPGGDEAGDRFGLTLAAADLTADGRADLAVGVPGEDVGAVVDAGSVTVLLGSPSGLATAGSRTVHQDTAGVPGGGERGDGFGGATGCGLLLRDLNRDGRADLAVAATGEDAGSGRVWTLRGTATGITTTGSAAFSAAGLGLPGPTGGLSFGSTLCP